MTASLHCPNCGAPVHPSAGHNLAICVYCNSSIRIKSTTPGETPAAPVVSEIAPEDMATLKQLLLEGKQQEALILYQRGANADAQEALEAIADLGRSLTFDIIRNQALTPFGIALALVCAIMLVVSIAAGVAGTVHPLLALLVGFLALFQLWYLLPSIRLSLEFARALIAPARILKVAPIGSITQRRQTVHTMRMWIEVDPPNGTQFRTELQVPVREQSMHKAQPGGVFEVRYLPGDSRRVMFHRAP